MKKAVVIIIAVIAVGALAFVPARNLIRGEEKSPCAFHGGVVAHSRQEVKDGTYVGNSYRYTCEDGSTQVWWQAPTLP